MGNEENYFLEKDEFIELKNEEKWNYIQSLMKLVKDYKIQAEKNCRECENNLLTAHDLNIDMYFEDWRDCVDHCDECTKDDLKAMCDVQFNLINHIANSLTNLEEKFNKLSKVVLYKNPNGEELLKRVQKELNKVNSKPKDTQTMFQ